MASTHPDALHCGWYRYGLFKDGEIQMGPGFDVAGTRLDRSLESCFCANDCDTLIHTDLL